MKFVRLNIAISLLCFSTYAAAQDQHVSACYKALENGKAAEALTHADQALSANKNNREALLCKGRSHTELEQYSEGVAALQAANKLSAKPVEHIVPLWLIGNAYKGAGQQSQALESYRQARAAAKAQKDIMLERLSLNLIGEAQVEAGQLDEGLQTFTEASELAANDTERGENYVQIASTHNKMGNHDKAVEYQVRAVLMKQREGERDQYAHAGLELGRYYTAAKDYIQAENAINKIAKFAQDNGSAYWEARANYYLGATKSAQGKPDEARTILQEAHQTARRIGATALADEIGNAMLNLRTP